MGVQDSKNPEEEKNKIKTKEKEGRQFGGVDKRSENWLK